MIDIWEYRPNKQCNTTTEARGWVQDYLLKYDKKNKIKKKMFYFIVGIQDLNHTGEFDSCRRMLKKAGSDKNQKDLQIYYKRKLISLYLNLEMFHNAALIFKLWRFYLTQK